MSISEVIGRRIPVKRHGREYQALCPFHKEKTPSFTINDDKGFYHCFGCGAHGDAINFIKEYDSLSWPEAVEKLAGEAGIAVPVMSRAEEERYQRAASLYDLMADVCLWFEGQRRQSQLAQQYLSQRGLKEETLKLFRVGFAPAGREALKQAMIAKGYSEQQLVQAGMLAVPDDGRSYDRFRERIMFPIRNVRGQIIAFGGRILPSAPNAATLAKYVNSPETELFKKGEVLYNLDLAKKAARDVGTVVVAEGYLDVIALSQAGITHAVAPLGTALTDRHLALLWKLSPEPIICLDGDEAGRRAMARMAGLALPMLQPSLSLRFAMLPKGEDPDSMIRGHGVGALKECLVRARPLSEALWGTYHAAIDQNTPERKAALEHALLQLTEKIQDKTVRSHYRNFFLNKIWPHRMGTKKPQSLTSRLAAPNLNPLSQTERHLIKLLLLYPDLVHQAEVEEALMRAPFTDTILESIKQALLEFSVTDHALTSEHVTDQLLARPAGEEVRKVLATSTVDFDKSLQSLRAEPSHARALELWQTLWGKYCSIQADAECNHMIRAMAYDLSDTTFERIMEIGKQMREHQGQVGIVPDEETHEKIA